MNAAKRAEAKRRAAQKRLERDTMLLDWDQDPDMQYADIPCDSEQDAIEVEKYMTAQVRRVGAVVRVSARGDSFVLEALQAASSDDEDEDESEELLGICLEAGEA